MKILIVGGGGREHALAWKCAQSDAVDKIYVAPGNAGTAMESKVENVAIKAEDIDALKQFAEKETIGLTIIGTEAPLVAGIVDDFQAAGLACFGPTKACAMLEGSKSFSKAFMQKYQIPTADYALFTEAAAAMAYVKSKPMPIVIKADGLAAGKGVVIAANITEANNAICDMLTSNQFGEAGQRIVIEEYLEGEEASFIVMADGKHVLALASSQDHKALYDGDTGPNTGGMGAYSPAPVVDEARHEQIMQAVIMPTIDGMASEGQPYTGFLYAGVMLTKDGEAKVLEFNCRFGDPEAQAILMRLNSDLITLCLAATRGKLEECNPVWEKQSALCVVTAAKGYPGTVHKGDVISGLEPDHFANNIKVFHAGTVRQGDALRTNGGRVLGITSLAGNIKQAQNKAYQALQKIDYEGIAYRSDIGYKAIIRQQ